jgi:hypothetical protein
MKKHPKGNNSLRGEDEKVPHGSTRAINSFLFGSRNLKNRAVGGTQNGVTVRLSSFRRLSGAVRVKWTYSTG